jgi:hypothetical protein
VRHLVNKKLIKGSVIVVKVQERATQPIIRDKAFAKRLVIACEGNPHCPTDEYRGKQKWVYDNLLEQFGIKVSPEAVRRWFSGEMRPRPKTVAALARLLEVDLGWLTLGTVPDMAPKEQKARNAIADGSVNLVAGLIQMNGGHVAFPDTPDAGADIFAIIGGKQYSIQVKLARDLGGDTMRFTVGLDASSHVVIGVIPSEHGFGARLVRLTPDIIAAQPPRGDFREIVIEQRGPWFTTESDRVPEIIDIKNLD